MLEIEDALTKSQNKVQKSKWFHFFHPFLISLFSKNFHPAFTDNVFKILPPSSHRWYQLPPPVESNKETRSSMCPAQTSQPLWLWWFENYYQFENQHSECPFKLYKRLQLKNKIPTNKAGPTQINSESSSSLTSTSTETPSDLLDLVELSLSVTVYPHCTSSEVLTMMIIIVISLHDNKNDFSLSTPIAHPRRFW